MQPEPRPDRSPAPRPAALQRPAPGLRLVLAPNPSAMTLHGTNTYILGEGRVAVIDPGPMMPGHLHAILAALAPGESVSHIFVTHAHLDHSPLSRPLAAATGAPVLAFGDARAGRSALMARLARDGLSEGGEGVDAGFAPDVALADGESVVGDGWALRALHTPGHFGNHICLEWQHGTFCGDHVMGWASTLISPPDGDLRDFLASLARLAARCPARLFPGHGEAVEQPLQRIAELAAHRETRSRQILAALSHGAQTPAELVARIYTDTPVALHAAAERNVFAHLVDLAEQNLVEPEPDLASQARFHRC